MGEALTIYGDPGSGNCLKVKWVAAHLGIPALWRDVDVPGGGTRRPEFLALNPAGRVPIVVLSDGTVLSESNAIIVYLAEGSALVPAEALPRARMQITVEQGALMTMLTRLLGVKRGAPLLEIDRVALTYHDAPVELRRSRVDTSRYDYLSDLGKGDHVRKT